MNNQEAWWDAFYHIALFALPLLKDLKAYGQAYPGEFGNMEEWHTVLDKIIFALEICTLENGDSYGRTDEEEAKVKEGLSLFGTYFRYLWD